MNWLARARLRTKLALLMGLSVVAVLVIAVIAGSMLHQGLYDGAHGRGDERRSPPATRAWKSPASAARDEIGEIAGSVQVFKDSMLEAERLRGEQEQQKARAEAERRQAMQGEGKLSRRSDGQPGGCVGRRPRTCRPA